MIGTYRIVGVFFYANFLYSIHSSITTAAESGGKDFLVLWQTIVLFMEISILILQMDFKKSRKNESFFEVLF